jgi:hypothetical protein
MSSSWTGSPEMPRHAYLSGGMEYAADEGRDWRKDLQAWLESELQCAVFNPNVESDAYLRTRHPGFDFRAMKHDNIDGYREVVRHLVETDCREIAQHADFVVCYWDDAAQRGAGTKGEITMAYYFGKPVYMVTALPPAQIPGWVLACTDRIFGDFDSLKAYLKSTAQTP